MLAVSATFLAAIRTAHSVTSKAVFNNPFTGALTTLPIETGSQITVDITAASRRVLTLSCTPLQSDFDAINAPGGEITVTQTFRFIDGTTETVTLGVFCLDQEDMGYGPGDQMTITAPDRWLQVQRNRFGLSRASNASNAAWQEIKALVEGAWPNSGYPFPGWASYDTTAITKVGPVIYQDGSRENAITSYTTANALEVFFNEAGLAVLRPLPVLTDASVPVWTLDAAVSGVFMGGDRKVDLSRTRNAVIVNTSATDIILTPVEVKDEHDPTIDPLSTLGPLGYRPGYYASPAVRTTDQATAAGKAILEKQLSTAQQVTVTAVPNPTLDGWDVVDVVFPPGDFGTTRPAERHMVESVTIPLTPDGVQTVTLRSTRPTPDDTT
jgi:hypothetical protein